MAREPRQTVGRRLWRRRKRRPAGGDALEAPQVDLARHNDDDDDDDDHDLRGALSTSVPARAPPPVPERRGFLARLFGKKQPPTPTYLVVDPVAEVLAIPRGAARLDAFEARLQDVEPGTDDHRRLVLAFHAELLALATEAGLDLGLFEPRVNACAAGLIAAGEDEKAGGLFARIGRRHQAAELFARAGAIDALEEAHAELAFTEGGARFEARLAFERFESLFLVGRRGEALDSLNKAVKLWDNPVYVEVLDGFVARLPAPQSVTLSAGDDVVSVSRRFPLVLGRGEESAVRIDSPLVSRAHVDIQRRDGELVLKDLVSSGGTRLDDVVLAGPTPLSRQGSIDLAGVVVEYDVTPERLLLRPRLRPRMVTIAARGDVVDDAIVGCRLRLDGSQVRLVADGRARLNGDAIRLDTLLLVGDRVMVSGRTWAVSG